MHVDSFVCGLGSCKGGPSGPSGMSVNVLTV